jgi:hypothetical protein
LLKKPVDARITRPKQFDQQFLHINMSAEDGAPGIDSGVDHITDKLGALNAQDQPRTEDDYAQAQLTLRAIVTSREAGVIIGKAGQNVADLRDKTGVRAGVSKVVPGVHDRVLTVTGPLTSISEAYGLVADGLVKGAPQMGMGGVISNPNTHRKRSLATSHIPTDPLRSHSTIDLAQSDGHHYWTARIEDQADSGWVWCAHGRSERDAATVYRTYR